MLKGKNQVKVIAKQNNKGQALVEFVLILPIILMILFIIIDFAHVHYERNHLESVLNDVIYMIKDDKSTNEIKSTLDEDVNYVVTNNTDFANVVMTKEVLLVTPFSNLFFDITSNSIFINYFCSVCCFNTDFCNLLCLYI